MTTLRSTRLLKGALISISPQFPVPTVVVFQYNPESLHRSIQPQMEGGSDASRQEAPRFKGAPIEEINVELDIDAIDQLEKGSQTAQSMGVLPQLAALEILCYPKSAEIISQAIMLAAGTIEITPTPAPFTLFVYGAARVLPVRVTSYSAAESEHDSNLNPIRAKVSLGLRVLTYSDLKVTDLGYHVFLAHQVAKEALALLSTATDASRVIGVDINKVIG